MSETLEQAAEAARQAIEKLNALGETWRAKADQLTRQRELPKDEKDGHYIDGHPIEYWHNIATATLKTNDELIDRVKARGEEIASYVTKNRTLADALREKERINADLETRCTFAETSLRTAEAVEKALQAKIADLEQQLKSTEVAAQGVVKDYMDASGYKGEDNYLTFINHLQRIAHQDACAKTAQDERDTALRELDAMRQKLIHAERQMDIAHTALLQR